MREIAEAPNIVKPDCLALRCSSLLESGGLESNLEQSDLVKKGSNQDLAAELRSSHTSFEDEHEHPHADDLVAATPLCVL